MDQLVWSAARRLGTLVVSALAVVGMLLVRDALLRRGALVAEVFAATAACLATVALLGMLRVRRFFVGLEVVPPQRRSPYRDNAHSPGTEPFEPDRSRATRIAARALMALAIAAAFVFVAAASR